MTILIASTEGAGSDKQKLPLDTSITFGHFKLRCAISVSLETEKLVLSAFETRMVKAISKAMAKVIQTAILKGTSNGQPIARVDHGIGSVLERTLFDRKVILTNDLPSFTASFKKTDVFAFIFNFSDYTLNTNCSVSIKKYEDNEKDDIVRKSIMIVDGKQIQYESLVKLCDKAAS